MPTFHAKWGSAYKYGNADRLYGAGVETLTGSNLWIFLVDWDNNGSFAYNEAQYMIDLETNRGERFLVRPGGNGFERIRPGEGNVTLQSINRRFDPDYAAGPLYGKIMPGRKFRLLVKDLATGTTYPVMAGFISDIPPISETETVQLAIRESLALLDRNTTSPTDYYDTVTNNLGDILNTAGFPSTFGSSLDTETLPITSLVVDNVNALDTLSEIAEACMGQIFADKTGRIRFYSLAHNSWTTIDLDQSQCDKKIRRSAPWENIRNNIYVTANKKIKSREEVLWQESSPIEVPAGNHIHMTVTWTEDAIDVYRYGQTSANSQADGKGINISNQCVVTDFVLYAKSAKIMISNAYSGTGYLTNLRIVGHPIKDKPIRAEASDSASVATYGEMVLDQDNKWLQDYNHAKAYAALLLAFLKDPKRTIEVQIHQRPDLQYSFDVMDKIHFQSAKLEIDETLHVGRIEHRWSNPTGQDVTTTLVMRPRLTSTDAIANDPRDPDLPFIPDDGDGGGGGGGGTPPGGDCLTDTDAPANGPWSLPGPYPILLQSNGLTSQTWQTNIPWYIRGPNSANTTYMRVFGDWTIWDTAAGEWVGETSLTNWHVYINGTIEGVINPITDNGHGMRTVSFAAGNIESINSVTFSLDAVSGGINNGYTAGDAITTVTMAANNQTGTQISGLTIGVLYTFDAVGGPWNFGSGSTYGRVFVANSANAAVVNELPIVYQEDIDANHIRVYHTATATSVWVRVNDSPGDFGDNSGSMDCTVRYGYSGEVHHMVISDVNLGNVCTV